jgi:hypothetical protein
MVERGEVGVAAAIAYREAGAWPRADAKTLYASLKVSCG